MQEVFATTEKYSGSLFPPEFLKNCQDKYQKKVRFDSTAVDNEYKMRSRQNIRRSDSAVGPHSFMIVSSSSSLANEAEAARLTERCNSPPVRSLPAGHRPQEAKRQLWETASRYSVQRRGDTHSRTQPLPFTVPLPHTETRDPGVMSSPAYQTSSKRPANSAAKRDKVPRRKITSHVLPRVPDAPSSQNRKPPPAPRPARLPTPDLEDIDGEMFCRCDSYVFGKASKPVGVGHLAKMDAQCMATSLW